MPRPDCQESGCEREADDAVDFVNPREQVPFCWPHAVEKATRSDARGVYPIDG